MCIINLCTRNWINRHVEQNYKIFTENELSKYIILSYLLQYSLFSY